MRSRGGTGKGGVATFDMPCKMLLNPAVRAAGFIRPPSLRTVEPEQPLAPRSSSSCLPLIYPPPPPPKATLGQDPHHIGSGVVERDIEGHVGCQADAAIRHQLTEHRDRLCVGGVWVMVGGGYSNQCTDALLLAARPATLSPAVQQRVWWELHVLHTATPRFAQHKHPEALR